MLSPRLPTAVPCFWVSSPSFGPNQILFLVEEMRRLGVTFLLAHPGDMSLSTELAAGADAALAGYSRAA